MVEEPSGDCKLQLLLRRFKRQLVLSPAVKRVSIHGIMTAKCPFLRSDIPSPKLLVNDRPHLVVCLNLSLFMTSVSDYDLERSDLSPCPRACAAVSLWVGS